MAIEISPNIAFSRSLTKTLEGLGYKELGEYVQCKWISVLDLTGFKNEDEILASFKRTP